MVPPVTTARCVVLLRGINVGGHNRLAMADLRTALAGIGCRNVVTYLQSGNAVVDADPEDLARRVEVALPLPVRVLVRTPEELAAVAAGCPWPARAAAQPKLVHVAFLDQLPDPVTAAALEGRHGDDELVWGDRAAYLSYATSSLDSPLAKALSRSKVDRAATARNWTTVCRLRELSGR